MTLQIPLTIFLTGGSGFIGSNFINYLFDNCPDISIINYDALTYAANQKALTQQKNNPNYHFIHGNICDLPTVTDAITTTNPDIIINFAAESHVDRSITDASPFISTNIQGVYNLLEICRKHDDLKFIQISTDEVYGTLGPDGFFTEASPIKPRSPYAASKASADLLTLAWHETYGLPVNITRCTNNYGPWQHPEKLIPMTIQRCLQKEKIPVYGNGLNVRDWIHVSDHCSGIATVMQNGKVGEVYNIGSKNEWKNLDLVKKIINITRDLTGDPGVSENLISFVPDRQGHDFRYAIDPDKITRELSWCPKITFKEGLVKTIRWYLKQQE
ncbi:dTDP-glucose 4,6-dehydratase [Methanospirillum hungatei JF-1]|uniref:dTDP-glucose 4,6-dehydratase n=1 Tax=Methanospirillum hungatei JF-1 (strain ATCC 27890 / DSM 864 / NBRC 100397 / JF-1) TaxID=323259 RepID=Q2FUN4_METHJ|nr:dTDP-glucose 4,6-dehydratase [Methanospirillum hungatei]ABD42787.1 dTDP-glucose 4,6-dehydratase [Methanospirillum hungatei JF-1]